MAAMVTHYSHDTICLKYDMWSSIWLCSRSKTDNGVHFGMQNQTIPIPVPKHNDVTRFETTLLQIVEFEHL